MLSLGVYGSAGRLPVRGWFVAVALIGAIPVRRGIVTRQHSGGAFVITAAPAPLERFPAGIRVGGGVAWLVPALVQVRDHRSAPCWSQGFGFGGRTYGINDTPSGGFP